jgi:hypothetical protein
MTLYSLNSFPYEIFPALSIGSAKSSRKILRLIGADLS